MPKNVAGFAAAYTLLALVTIASGFGAYAAYQTHGIEHKVAHVSAQLGDQNLTRIADRYIAQSAQAQGYAVEEIVITKIDVKGDIAHVHALISVTDGVSSQKVAVIVDINRGVWQPVGVRQG